MSDNSNDPKREITFYDARFPSISINVADNFAHVFFGDTPRAQLSIRILRGKRTKEEYIAYVTQQMLTLFPNASFAAIT